MHDRFGQRTEQLMHQLFDSSAEALRASSAIQSALMGVDEQLAGVGGQLSAVQRDQAEMGALARETLQQSRDVRGQIGSIQEGLQTVKEAGVRTMLWYLLAISCSTPGQWVCLSAIALSTPGLSSKR
jgi:hypothetical protein